eukprot:5352301-Pleurochrysis_carterae.AAC.7
MKASETPGIRARNSTPRDIHTRRANSVASLNCFEAQLTGDKAARRHPLSKLRRQEEAMAAAIERAVEAVINLRAALKRWVVAPHLRRKLSTRLCTQELSAAPASC